MGRFFVAGLAAAAGFLVGSAPGRAADLVVNGGFELPDFGGPNQRFDIPEAQVPGWDSSDGSIEIWSSGFQGVNAYSGDQFSEINSSTSATLFQDITGITSGTLVGYDFAHRGRDGLDTIDFKITDMSTMAVLFSKTFSTDNTAWAFYTDANVFAATGNTLRISFTPISSAGGISRGNFLDAVAFGEDVGSEVPGPLPLLGVGAMFGFSRRLRHRMKGNCVSRSNGYVCGK